MKFEEGLSMSLLRTQLQQSVLFFYVTDWQDHQLSCHNLTNQGREADLAKSLGKERDLTIRQMFSINQILR